MPVRSGLTLVELLVVLVILAVLTTVAVSLTDTLVDQARFEATQNTLNNIQTAMMGPVNQGGDSTALQSGFIADMGRPPLAVANADPSQALAELWANPLLLPGYASYGSAALTPILSKTLTPAGVPLPPTTTVAGVSTMTAQIQVMAGWRGPYLRLPPQPGNVSQLFDSWGNPFTLLQADKATPAVPYQSGAIAPANLVSYVQSHGGPTAPYIGLLTTQSPATSYTASVTGSVNNPTTPPSNPVYVLLFYPDMTQSPTPVNVAWAIASSGAGSGSTGGGTGGVIGTGGAGYTFTFTGVPVGPRVLLVYQATGTNQVAQYIRVPLGGLTIPTINGNFL